MVWTLKQTNRPSHPRLPCDQHDAAGATVDAVHRIRCQDGNVAHYRAVAERGSPALDGALFVGAVSVALVAYSSTIQLVPAYTALYVPLNLGATAVLLAAARRAGLGRDDLALRPGALGSGVRWGGAIALVAAVGLGVALAVPALHPLLEDERVGDIGYGLLAYRTLIRIPLGTVVLEEIAFRGVLFGSGPHWTCFGPTTSRSRPPPRSRPWPWR